METYIRFLRRHRLALAALAVLVIAGGLRLASRLEVETDWRRLFPYADPEFRQSLDLIDQLGRAMGLTFLFTPADGEPARTRSAAIAELLETIRASGLFAEVIAGLDQPGRAAEPAMLLAFAGETGAVEMARRLTPAGMREMLRADERLLFTPAGGMLADSIRADPLQAGQLALPALAWHAGFALQDGAIVSADQRTQLVIAIPRERDLGAGGLRRLADLMQRLRTDAAAHGLVCRMPGSAFLRAELLVAVQRDIVLSVVLSAVAILAAFLLVYRGSVRALLCVLLPVLFALALTFGAYALACRTIDLIAAMSVAMLVGLGVDFGIHFMARYRLEAGTEVERLARVLQTTGRGVISGALTTVAACLSILFTGMKSFHLLGVIAGGGILLALLAAWFVFPLAVLLLRPDLPPAAAETPLRRGLYRLGARVFWPALILPLLMLPLAARRFYFESDFRMFLPRASQVLQDMAAAPGADNLADGLILEVASRGYAADSALQDALEPLLAGAQWKSPFMLLPAARQLDRQRAAFRVASRAQGLSPARAVREFARALAENEWRAQAEYDDYIQALFRAYQPGFWETNLYHLPLVRPFFSDDRGRFFIMATQTNGRPWTARQATDLARAAEQRGAAAQAISGNLLVARIRARVIPDSLRAAVVSLLLVFGILWLHMRDAVRTLLVLTPLVFGLLITFTILGLAGLSFNFFNLPVIGLLFGLGIDDGVHFMQAFRETRATRTAFLRTVAPIGLTTLTTCLGFGSLLTVSFRGVALMGLFVTIGMTACLLATLVILPGFTRRLEGKRMHADV